MKLNRKKVEPSRPRGTLGRRLTAAVACLWLTTAIEAGDSPLFVNPSDYDFSENPKLLDRILASPHGYFRFINVAFGRRICTQYAGLVVGAPQLNLHGDAHLEQYAITDLGRGLTDFDDSSVGPGIIDLLRFGVSLRLTCQANGWAGHSADIFNKFLKGYSDALRDAKLQAAEPTVATRIRSGFQIDRKRYLATVDQMMQPVPNDIGQRLIEAVKPYAENVRLERLDLEPEYFRVEKLGYLKLGIGSALDTKFLLRLRGLTDAAGDDVVVELKQVRDLQGIGCVQASQNDPFRILLSQARIAYQPFDLLGYIRLDNSVFWVHSWVDNYREVSVEGDLRGPEELAELAYDVGVQLGLGHPKLIAAPFDVQVRRAQLRLLDRRRAAVDVAVQELSEDVVTAWEEFVRSASRRIR